MFSNNVPARWPMIRKSLITLIELELPGWP